MAGWKLREAYGWLTRLENVSQRENESQYASLAPDNQAYCGVQYGNSQFEKQRRQPGKSQRNYQAVAKNIQSGQPPQSGVAAAAGDYFSADEESSDGLSRPKRSILSRRVSR